MPCPWPPSPYRTEPHPDRLGALVTVGTGVGVDVGGTGFDVRLGPGVRVAVETPFRAKLLMMMGTYSTCLPHVAHLPQAEVAPESEYVPIQGIQAKHPLCICRRP